MLSFLKPIARAGLKAVLTKRLFAQWASVRSRNYQVRWHKRAGHLNIAKAVVEKLGCEVVAGPFEGMKYPKESLLSRYSVPHLLGTYERELHPVLNALIRDKYDKLIDIGCAEGYYAVGLAMKFQRPMHAFDTDPRELSRCRIMASLNGVRDLVKCRPWCSADNLHGLCNEACCLIVCDCEGGELDLFTRDTIASITHCDLLIEFHDLASLNTRDSLVDLFRLTHKVSIFTFSSTSDPPSVAGLAALGDIPLREFRNPNQQWGWFTPIA
jgi:hypothetical protein